MGVMRSDSNSPGARRVPPGRGVLATLLALLAWVACEAQEPGPGVELPEVRHLAAALSDPESREDSLLTLIVAVRLREAARADRAPVAAELAERFRADRAWLDRLAARYPRLPLRSPVLDPSAWFLLQELDQFEQVAGPWHSPLGPPLDDLLTVLFDTSNERVAATLLPEFLSRVEPEATARWRDLLAAAGRDDELRTALAALAEEWFEPWTAAEPPAPSTDDDNVAAVDIATGLLQQLAEQSLQAGPPDPLRLKRLRHGLHSALPEMAGDEARDAAFLLLLAEAIDGLRHGEYLALTESLVWVASRLLLDAQQQAGPDESAETPVAEAGLAAVTAGVENPQPGEAAESAAEPSVAQIVEEEGAAPEPPAYVSALPRALSDLLPALSSAFSPEFSRVEPRIGAALATVFDAVQYFNTGQTSPERLRILLSGTADVVAQWVLLIPDMSYYFDQPIRGPVGSAIADCIAAAARAAAGAGEASLSPEAAERCVAGIAESAVTNVRSTELAGDPDGPFGTEQLLRELQLASWQRVNYVLGYLQEEVAPACRLPDEALPNPLEWTNLVAVLDRFARSAPYRFREDGNRAMIASLREQGEDLLAALAGQADCISGTGAGAVDPVLHGLAEYREALGQLVAGLREAELAFRAENLEPGADLVLRGGSGQSTAYRPEDRVIGPCDEASVCEMRDTLEASPALLARFPDVYLLADQARQGAVEICYDNVRWVDRRAEPVRADDPHVANYHGRLAFDLLGRYREGEEVRDVFGFSFTSPDEYHYLFGPATDEVLNDPCPTEWVGTRITTGLGGDGRFRVVPDRLTYLAAARSLPSRTINANWARGGQWRAAFETGYGVRSQEHPGDPGLAERLDRRLQALYQAEQATLYDALFTQPERVWRRRSDSLYDRLAAVSARKALIGAYVDVLYPQAMIDSDEIRGLLEGRGALLDERMLRQFRREGVPVASVNATGVTRLERMVGEWNRLPDDVRRSGSVAIAVAHALVRLTALERDIFERLLPGEYAPLSPDQLDG